MQTHRVVMTVAAALLAAAAVAAQSDARRELARGVSLWDQRLAKSAIAALEAAPAPYFTGAQILIDRGEYARAIAMAERGIAVSDRFIDENLSAYQMSGK